MKLNFLSNLPLKSINYKKIILFGGGAILVISLVLNLYLYFKYSNVGNTMNNLNKSLSETNLQLADLKNQDQYQINQQLTSDIDSIKKSYEGAVDVYENLLDLKQKVKDTKDEDENFTQILTLLSETNYQEADTKIASLSAAISQKMEEATKVVAPPSAPIVESTTPPSSGYSRQNVTSEAGTFTVSMIAADLSNTRVVVDTASDSTCTDNCPVLPLATYVSRSGAFAGVNGSYFCPASYPSCVGKTNSFDLLLMNKNKIYFNSDNNVYSSNPGVVFGDGYIRFLGHVSEWGRDTGITGMLSNYPLLVSGGNVVYSGDSDAKHQAKGARGFVANKGNTVYIGVVHSVTVAESAKTLKALGMENALNLDDGGSTALWSGGYKVGPGRDLPNVILFVAK